MTSTLAARPDARLGDQRPRILWQPPSVTSAGPEAVELAASAGLVLDPWEAFCLEVALAEREDGNWAAFEVGLLVSRQNGKGAILEARELAGLFLFGEQLILHSAHEFKTAQEGFRRVLSLFENTDDLRRRVKRVRTSHGEEGIELLSGQRLRFVARTGGSGRGFTGDTILLDEAFNLPDAATEALMPTVSARPNPQIWYTSSAPDKELAPCEVLARVRKRGMAGGDPALAYLEWSVDPHSEFCGADCGAHDDPDDPKAWARANPGMGIRISAEHIGREFRTMSAEGFARERLGVGRWPLERGAWGVIDEADWQVLADPRSLVESPIVLAGDVSWDRSWGSIAVAGRRTDGLFHVEVIEHRPRTDWVVPRMRELKERWGPLAVMVRSRGPAGFLIPELEAAGIEVANMTTAEGAQACGLLYQTVTDTKNLRHLGQPELAAALSGVVRKPVGDAWTWARKGDGIGADLTPLYAATDALWGYASRAHIPGPGLPAIY
jgi:Phage Terminase